MMSFCRLAAVGLMAFSLTGCLSVPFLDKLALGDGAKTEAVSQAPKTATTTPSREKVMKKATKAMGAEVVARKGEYLLCSTVDTYKSNVTTYYLCRERQCVGQESLAKNVKAPKTKSGCLATCRKQETKRDPKAKIRAYCVN